MKMGTKFLPRLMVCMCIHTVSCYQCLDTELCKTINYMRMTSKIQENEISLMWDFNSTDSFYGFQVKVMNSDKVVFYSSPILHFSNTRMDFVTESLSSVNHICLQVLYNSSLAVGQICDNIEINDLKIIIGIMAGAVFLVPCILVLGIFIYKDKQMRNFQYQDFDSGRSNNSYTSEEELSSSTSHKVFHKPSPSGKIQKKKKVNATPIMEVLVEDPTTTSTVLEHKPDKEDLKQESLDAVEKQSSNRSSQEDMSSVYVIRL